MCVSAASLRGLQPASARPPTTAARPRGRSSTTSAARLTRRARSAPTKSRHAALQGEVVPPPPLPNCCGRLMLTDQRRVHGCRAYDVCDGDCGRFVRAQRVLLLPLPRAVQRGCHDGARQCQCLRRRPPGVQLHLLLVHVQPRGCNNGNICLGDGGQHLQQSQGCCMRWPAHKLGRVRVRLCVEHKNSNIDGLLKRRRSSQAASVHGNGPRRSHHRRGVPGWCGYDHPVMMMDDVDRMTELS